MARNGISSAGDINHIVSAIRLNQSTRHQPVFGVKQLIASLDVVLDELLDPTTSQGNGAHLCQLPCFLAKSVQMYPVLQIVMASHPLHQLTAEFHDLGMGVIKSGFPLGTV